MKSVPALNDFVHNMCNREIIRVIGKGKNDDEFISQLYALWSVHVFTCGGEKEGLDIAWFIETIRACGFDTLTFELDKTRLYDVAADMMTSHVRHIDAEFGPQELDRRRTQ